MTSRLDRHASTLKLLSRSNQKMAQNILKSAGDDLKCISDCTLKRTQRKRVCLSKAKVEADAAQKSFARSCKEKSLAPLLSAVIPAIASLLTVFSRR